MKKTWKTLHTESLFSTPFFRLEKEECITSTGKKLDAYYRLEVADWVQVVAIQKNGDFVLIDQYRHGFRDQSIEVPGGVVDPGEDLLEAAKRELREETGYEAKTWIALAESCPNPALQSNKLVSFLALDAEKVSEQNLDPFEEIEVFTSSREGLEKMIDEGKIKHSLMLMSIGLALRYLDKGEKA